jgi:hypothetical protein
MGKLGTHAKCKGSLKIGTDGKIHCPKCEPQFFDLSAKDVNFLRAAARVRTRSLFLGS